MPRSILHLILRSPRVSAKLKVDDLNQFIRWHMKYLHCLDDHLRLPCNPHASHMKLWRVMQGLSRLAMSSVNIVT